MSLEKQMSVLWLNGSGKHQFKLWPLDLVIQSQVSRFIACRRDNSSGMGYGTSCFPSMFLPPPVDLHSLSSVAPDLESLAVLHHRQPGAHTCKGESSCVRKNQEWWRDGRVHILSTADLWVAAGHTRFLLPWLCFIRSPQSLLPGRGHACLPRGVRWKRVPCPLDPGRLEPQPRGRVVSVSLAPWNTGRQSGHEMRLPLWGQQLVWGRGIPSALHT